MIAYLFQMIVCSGFLYAYYHFLLRNEKFHRYNRFFLISIIIISLVLPLVKIPVTVPSDNSNIVYQSLEEWNSSVTIATQKSPQWFSAAGILQVCYAVVALFFIIRIVIGIQKIIHLKKNNPSEQKDGIRFINTAHPDTPFSFFRWLFWNRGIELQSDKGQQIFRHEMYHIEKKHSWDLIFSEMITAVFWVNPFFHLIKKEIKIIQEFLADQHATNLQNTSSYAELLLLQAFGSYQHQLVNPFFHNQLKRRITMLTSSKKPAHQYLRKLMILPLIAIAIVLFAFTYKKEIKKVNDIVITKIEEVQDIMQPVGIKKETKVTIKDTVPVVKNKEKQIKLFRYDTEKKNYGRLNPITIVAYADENYEYIKPPKDRIDIEAAYPGGVNSWNTFLERNILGDVATVNGARPGKYEVAVRFTVEPDGNLANFEPLTDQGYGMEEEVIRILKRSGKWKPAINNKDGDVKAVRAYRTQPVIFVVQGKKQEDIKGTEAISTTSDSGKGVVEIKKPNPPVTPSAKKDSVKITEVTIEEIKKPKQEPEIFAKVDTEAMFPGGPQAWRKFLEKNLRADVATENGAKPGTYTTIIQFIVDKDGTVSDVKPLTNIGYGLEQEAVRVIKKSGKWKPAIQNGKVVKAYRKQPITYQIQRG